MLQSVASELPLVSLAAAALLNTLAPPTALLLLLLMLLPLPLPLPLPSPQPFRNPVNSPAFGVPLMVIADAVWK
uniref:Putative secreted peptide n=1 Tax=Anopheles braziliensis TaxID=58242 RepID=A0A2M3ZU20_9DIPT